MWTNENRARYDRRKLRYPSIDDEEWALIAPLIPPAKRGGNKSRQVINGLMYPEHRMSVGSDPQGPAAAQHSPTTSSDGNGTRPHFYECRESARDASPTVASSTARASRALKKGGFNRPATIGQEDRQEAARPGRHAPADSAIVHTAGTGSRRWCAADERSVRRVSVPAPAVCRQRLPWLANPGRSAAGVRSCERAERSEVGKFVVLPKRFVDAPSAGRTDAESAQRLRMLERKRTDVPEVGLDQTDGPKAMSENGMISDRL